MVTFFAPVIAMDLSRIEEILRKGGIEYILSTVSEGRQVKLVISVAEIDFPAAQELLLTTR